MTYYDLCFLAALAGGSVGALRVRRHRWFMLQRPRARRVWVEAASVLAWVLGPSLLILGATWAAGGETPTEHPRALALSVAHVSALAFFLHRTPLPSRLIPLGLVALAWWIPALIPQTVGLLDPSPKLAPSPEGPETWGALTPVGTLLLAALLLPQPRGPMR